MIESAFRQMSLEEMNIEEIENIKMIHIYDLAGAATLERKYGVTAVLVNFGDNKQLNYTENDHCFNVFVNKLFEAYNNSPNKLLISMDDDTRKIMEAGKVPRHEGILGKYYDAKKQEMPAIVNASTLSKRFEPFIEYILLGLYKTMGLEADLIEKRTGWRGAGRLSIHVGNQTKMTYYRVFEIDNNAFLIKLNGCFSQNGDMDINIIFYDDMFSISYKSDAAAIEGSSSFRFSKDSVREMHQIKKNGKQLFYDVNTYANTFKEEDKLEDCLSVSSLKLLPEGIKPCAVYSLPMGLDYILYDSVFNEEDVEVETFCGAFLWQQASLADLRGWSVIKSEKLGIALKNEAFWIINLTDNREFIQSSFLRGTGSRYKEELEGKYIIKDRKSV